MIQQVQSEYLAVLAGPCPVVEGKKNSSSYIVIIKKHITQSFLLLLLAYH